jgi:deuterolysin
VTDELTLAAPKSVASINDIKVTVSVTNTGSEAVKVLKYGTALDSELPTKSFVIKKDGQEATFGGIKLQVNPDIAGDSAFVVIPAGETVTAIHTG